VPLFSTPISVPLFQYPYLSTPILKPLCTPISVPLFVPLFSTPASVPPFQYPFCHFSVPLFQYPCLSTPLPLFSTPPGVPLTNLRTLSVPPLAYPYLNVPLFSTPPGAISDSAIANMYKDFIRKPLTKTQNARKFPKIILIELEKIFFVGVEKFFGI